MRWARFLPLLDDVVVALRVTLAILLAAYVFELSRSLPYNPASWTYFPATNIGLIVIIVLHVQMNVGRAWLFARKILVPLMIGGFIGVPITTAIANSSERRARLVSPFVVFASAYAFRHMLFYIALAKAISSASDDYFRNWDKWYCVKISLVTYIAIAIGMAGHVLLLPSPKRQWRWRPNFGLFDVTNAVQDAAVLQAALIKRCVAATTDAGAGSAAAATVAGRLDAVLDGLTPAVIDGAVFELQLTFQYKGASDLRREIKSLKARQPAFKVLKVAALELAKHASQNFSHRSEAAFKNFCAATRKLADALGDGLSPASVTAWSREKQADARLRVVELRDACEDALAEAWAAQVADAAHDPQRPATQRADDEKEDTSLDEQMSFSVSSSSSESSQPRHTDPLARARRGVRLCAFAAAMLELPSRVSNGEAAEPHAESARRDPTLRGFCQRCRNSVVWLWSFVAPMVPSGLLEPRAEWAALWLPATKLAIGLVLASMWLVAPGLSDQNSRNGRSHWVGTTYIIVSTKDYGHSTTKCVNRVFGTAVAMGALGPIVQRSDNANWTDDHLTILLCVWVFVCAYAMTQLEVDLVYRATVASTTGALLFFDSDDSKNYVLYRTAFILYGVGLYLAVESTIFPTSSRNDVENFSREFVSAVDAALSDVLSALASEDAAAWQKYVESIAALRLRAAAAVADLPGARMEPHFGLRRPFLNATYTKLSLEQLRCVKGLTILSHALQRLDAATAQALLGSSQRRCVAGGSKAVVRRAAEAVAERTRDCSTRAAPLFALAAAASSTAEGEDESRQGVPLAEELFAALGPFRDFALAEDELCREWGTLLEAQLDKRSQRPVAPLVTLAAGLAVFALMDVCASLGRVGASLEQLAVASPTFLPTRQQPPKLEAQPKQEARPKDAEDPAAD